MCSHVRWVLVSVPGLQSVRRRRGGNVEAVAKGVVPVEPALGPRRSSCRQPTGITILQAICGATEEEPELKERGKTEVDGSTAYISMSVPSPASASVFACLLGGACTSSPSVATFVAAAADRCDSMT